jgi:hypothetical protein
MTLLKSPAFGPNPDNDSLNALSVIQKVSSLPSSFKKSTLSHLSNLILHKSSPSQTQRFFTKFNPQTVYFSQKQIFRQNFFNCFFNFVNSLLLQKTSKTFSFCESNSCANSFAVPIGTSRWLSAVRSLFFVLKTDENASRIRKCWVLINLGVMSDVKEEFR